MKKFLLFFLFFIILCGITAELVSYNILFGTLRKCTFLLTEEKIPIENIIFSFKEPDVLSYHFSLPNRSTSAVFEGERKKESILTFGCSYTYGQFIEDDETFASQLKKITKKHTNNMGIIGSSHEDALKLVSQLAKTNQLKDDNYKFIIYTLMYEHIDRVFDFGLMQNYLSQKNMDDKNLLNRTYSYKLFNLKKMFREDNFDRLDYLKYTLCKINQILKTELPDSTFIVLLYDDVTNCTKSAPPYENEFLINSLQPSTYDELKELGIKIVSTKELVGDVLHQQDYQLMEDPNQWWRPHHPNGKAWEIIAPKIAEKYNM